MICVKCSHDKCRRFGKDRRGNQRFRCRDCKEVFTEPRKRLIGSMRIPLDRAKLILLLLLEGNSIRSIERICRTDKKTIIALLVKVGERCARFLKTKIKNVLVDCCECDELWPPIFCREHTRELRGYGSEVGDSYTYVGMERHTKLILAYHVGRRSLEDIEAFCYKLAAAVCDNCQIDTDGWRSYQTCIPAAFGGHASHGICVKQYGRTETEVDRYERAKVVGTKRWANWGNPNVRSISTSRVERGNLGIRTQYKQFARLTLSYSKSRDNHKHAFALYVAYFNFCRVHSTIKTLPAVANGIKNHVWSLRELLENTADVY